jgi:pectate lyase C
MLNGTFTCSVTTFGSDPLPSKSVKECSVPSNSGSSPPTTPVTNAITLNATPGNGQVTLNWTYSGLSAATQEIYRDLDADPNGRVRIASVGGGTTSFTDTNLTNGTTYWYSIKNTGNGVVTNSTTVSATPSGGTSVTPPASGTVTGASCATNGAVTTVTATIRVTSGVFDGGCRRFNAGAELGDGGQSEGQSPIFRVENGATLRNVVIGANGADGIHVYNGAVINNVHWLNVGEDALTIKSSGTVTVSNIEGYDAEDKFFQVNAASTLRVSNCIIHRAGKALRQNGDTDFRINVSFDRCDINTMEEGVFRTDSSVSTATLTNSRLRDAGSVCIGPWASCTQTGNTNY